jgi:hypothetical protein
MCLRGYFSVHDIDISFNRIHWTALEVVRFSNCGAVTLNHWAVESSFALAVCRIYWNLLFGNWTRSFHRQWKNHQEARPCYNTLQYSQSETIMIIWVLTLANTTIFLSSKQQSFFPVNIQHAFGAASVDLLGKHKLLSSFPPLLITKLTLRNPNSLAKGSVVCWNTKLKAASFPNEVIECFQFVFYLPNPSSLIMALELTQPLTEFNTTNLTEPPARKADNPICPLWADCLENAWASKSHTTITLPVLP